MNKGLKKSLRDKAIEQLLVTLTPFEITALNMNDIAHDDNGPFLRVLNRRNNSKQFRFVPMSSIAQKTLETFLKESRPLYKTESKALFLNRFGRRMSTRSIHKQHGRTSQVRVEREIIEVGKPCGKSGIEWFNKWGRASVVYFVQRQDGIIKVGYSAAGFATRFKTLEHEYGQLTLLGIIEGNKWLEGKVKRQFRHLCVEGTEWFRPDSELLAFIQKVVETGKY